MKQYENTIIQGSQSGSTTGIEVLAALNPNDRNNIRCNLIQNQNSDARRSGIFISQISNNNIRRNELRDLGTGIRINPLSIGQNLENNEFVGGFVGLHIDSRIGIQQLHGNQWNTDGWFLAIRSTLNDEGNTQSIFFSDCSNPKLCPPEEKVDASIYLFESQTGDVSPTYCDNEIGDDEDIDTLLNLNGICEDLMQNDSQAFQKTSEMESFTSSL